MPAGRWTLRVKQSSPVSVTSCTKGEIRSSPRTSVGMLVVFTWLKNWGHALGMPVAANVPDGYDAVIDCGGFSRRLPVGGRANGMPLKDSTLPVELPTIVPFLTTAEGTIARFSSKGAARAVVSAATATRRDRMRIDSKRQRKRGLRRDVGNKRLQLETYLYSFRGFSRRPTITSQIAPANLKHLNGRKNGISSTMSNSMPRWKW